MENKLLFMDGEKMKTYKVLFQGDDVLVHIKANNAKEARRLFSKNNKI